MVESHYHKRDGGLSDPNIVAIKIVSLRCWARSTVIIKQSATYEIVITFK